MVRPQCYDTAAATSRTTGLVDGCWDGMGGNGGWKIKSLMYCSDWTDHRLSAASKSTCTHTYTCWHEKFPFNEKQSTQHYEPAAISPIHPKALPSDLVSHCSFGELSKSSFTVKRHERHLTLLLCWWLTFTTLAPNHRLQIIHTQLALTENNSAGTIKHKKKENIRAIRKRCGNKPLCKTLHNK